MTRHYPRLDALIARLDGVLAGEPGTAWARFYRGVAWFRRGELQRALDDMERAIDRMRDLAGAYFELGRLYLALYLDEHRAARGHLSEEGADAELRMARNRVQQAGIAFAEARRLKQDLPQWQAGYVEAVQRLAEKDFAGCVARCDAILAGDPDLEEIWKLKGDALRAMGEDPMPAYARAVDTRRSYHEALLAMAEAHLEAGRPAESREALVHALETHSGLVAAEVLWARTHLVEARAGSAESLELGLERAAAVSERNRAHYDATVTLAELEIEKGRAASDGAWLTAALDRLARARGLRGCANRVGFLEARARLERARVALAAPAPDRDAARADLEAVVAQREQQWASAADNAPWRSLFDEAEAELARL